MTPLISVQHLKKYFPVRSGLLSRVSNWVRAVDDVSFEVYPGETLALVGESGCGKTTVGRCLLRLQEPTAGDIVFAGQDLRALQGNALRQMRQHLQMVFQDPYSSLNPRMTVSDIVGEAMQVHGLTQRHNHQQKVEELLARVGLDPLYHCRYPHEFSGGQRQRIGIARALALQPKFIVCDEAVSALDVSIQAQIINLLKQLQTDFELSYLFISHDLNVVRHLADRIAVMYLGQIVEIAPTQTLFEHAQHPYTQALLKANPVPDPDTPPQSACLQGDVPSPLNPPSGCRFHTRCRLAMESCKTIQPQIKSLNAQHSVRCLLLEENSL